MSTIFRDPVMLNGLAWNVDPLEDNTRLICDVLDGWDDTADLDVVISPGGHGGGGVWANDFPSKEKYLFFGGAVVSPTRVTSDLARVKIMRTFAPGDLTLSRTEPLGVFRMQVRVAGPITFPQRFEEAFRFLVPLVAEDPLKYGATVTRGCGMYSGGFLYRTYSRSGGTTSSGIGVDGGSSAPLMPSATYDGGAATATATRTIDGGGAATVPGTPTGSKYYRTLPRTYQAPPNYKDSRVVFDNSGDADTYPVTTVTGPLVAGGWYVYNETTDKILSFNVEVKADQTLVIDHRRQTAKLDGYDVSYLIRGKYWGMPPGLNSVQLVGSEYNNVATLTVSAAPARR